MRYFLRIIALLLAFTLPLYGFASVSKSCDHQDIEQAGSSMSVMMVTASDVDATLDSPGENMGLDSFDFSLSCSAADSGYQCQIGILPSPLALAEPAPPVYPSLYNISFTQVLLEQPQRPPQTA